MFSIPASAPDAAAVNHIKIKTFGKDLLTFFINDNPVFNNGPRSLPRNPSDYVILDNWVFNNLRSVDNWFPKS